MMLRRVAESRRCSFSIFRESTEASFKSGEENTAAPQGSWPIVRKGTWLNKFPFQG